MKNLSLKSIVSLYSIISLLLFFSFAVSAQGPANRTASTVVADVLAQLPADRQADYNRQMQELVSTGEEGILQLVKLLNPPGKGSNVPADYALSGITHYVSAAGREKAREVTVNALQKALQQIQDAEIRAFLHEQLRILGAGKAYTEVPARPLPSPTTAEILNALKNPSIEYRNTMLALASPQAGEDLYVALFKYLPKAVPAVKTDIINYTGREAQCPAKKAILDKLTVGRENATQVLLKQLKSSDLNIIKATTKALVALGDEQAISALADLLAGKDPQAVDPAKNALASFKGDISPAVALAVTRAATDKGKIAGIELLALRKSDKNLPTVLKQTASGSADVKAAAYRALKDVVTENDLETLALMLESTDRQYVAPIQQAGIAALSSLPTEQQAGLIIGRMNETGSDRKSRYYLPLAATGDKRAIPFITEGFSKGDKDTKDAAFDALLNWKGIEAADLLYAICQDASASAYFNRAFAAYVKLAAKPSLTGENRLIFLRKAMEISKTDAQRNDILKKIGQTNTYPGLLYAGEFIDRPALKENAAQAVMNIALDNKEFTGENVVALLQKASAALNNPDAEYQRQSIQKHLAEMPKEKGFVSLFNGKDLAGWKGLVENPVKRAQMKPEELAQKQAAADKVAAEHWKAEDGLLIFDGKKGGDNLCTEKQYGDFEMYVDWLLDPAGPEADAGIYLRGAPQVQIWDTSRVKVGAQVGSGGLYNNKVHPSKPLKVADNRLGEWNTLYIKMIGDRVTVKLNGHLVVDNVILENYWDRSQPIFPVEQIELQAHGSKVYYRNLYLKELERPEPFKLSAEEAKDGYKILFDGTNMHEWTGNTADYILEDGCISMHPSESHGGNLYTKKEYDNFVFRFEFLLTPSANNGVGIRAPMEGDNAYNAMEIQILDCEHPVYRNIRPYQHHGSVYGIVAAEHGAMKPVGEWNEEEIYADGNRIRVTLNGKVILDADIREATKNGTADHKEHPGLFNEKGHIGFLGHGSHIKFKNIRVKELKAEAKTKRSGKTKAL